jgi:hypothetical protein
MAEELKMPRDERKSEKASLKMDENDVVDQSAVDQPPIGEFY